jgi:outer membrane protein OmpA-like peptidoglycan-associated protein
MTRSSLVVVALTAALSFAQSGDEWNTYPRQPPATAPAQETPALPVRPPPPVSRPAPPTTEPVLGPVSPPPTSAPKVTVPVPVTADAGVRNDVSRVELESADAGDYQVVSQRERYLPGTEPHSPSTWLAAWDASENARVTVGQVGVSAAFVPSARLGPKGLVRVSLLGEYLSLGAFPVQGAQDIRSAVTFAASYQPFAWGEVFLAYGASANSSSRTAPNLLQALGDLTLGVKVSREWARGLWAGVDLRLLTFSGVGNQGLDRFAVGVRPTLLATYDFRTLSRYAAVIATLNLGFTFDSTGGLVKDQRLTASEEFALDVNRYHRFNFALAAEVPLPFVTPFLEYGFALPLVGSDVLVGPDGVPVSTTAAMGHRLGLGLKVTAVKDVTLLTGFSFGLAQRVGLGVPATPPWNFWFGASFAIDPFQRGETRFVETLRDRKTLEASAVRLEGVVTDVDSRKPVAGVVIALGGGARPSATDEGGAYRTLELSGPSATVTATREGYRTLQREVTLEAGRPTRLDLVLDPEVRKATFEISTSSEKRPVKATVSFSGAAEARLETLENPQGPLTTELPPGRYTVTASAEGYLSQVREVQVTSGASLPVAFELVPAPSKMLVVLRGDKIEIAQQVHFATGKAAILADSYNLLQQVADVIIKNGVKKIKVEGHTDNRGDKAANQALSEARARSVADFLVSQGFEQGRITSEGYGDSRPIAPNLTARGRELNRRVEFLVLEK